MLGKSISAPDDDAWRVIYYLRFRHRATAQDIAAHLGKSRVAIAPILRRLIMHKPPIAIREGENEL